MLTFIPVEILKIICNGHKIEIPKKYTISTIYSRNSIISSNGYNVYGTKKLSFEHNNKYLTGSAVVQIPSKDFVFFVFFIAFSRSFNKRWAWVVFMFRQTMQCKIVGLASVWVWLGWVQCIVLVSTLDITCL